MGSPVETGSIEAPHRQQENTAQGCDPEQGCITCGDVAVPLEVLRVDADRGLALCRDEQGRRETVETALVLPVRPGDRLLVHAGTAISQIGAQTDPAPTPLAPGREAEEVRA